MQKTNSHFQFLSYLHQPSAKMLLTLYIIIAALTIYLFDGTGDPGDSVLHYLYAHYAFQQPELYFDHWAKPFFVLLSSPFAQFGFVGMKVFNAGITTISLYCTYRVAKSLGIAFAEGAMLFYMFAPLCYVLTFSGLTEPLFACVTIASAFFWIVKKNHILAFSLLSFLPFVRSEGLIFVILLGLYGIWKQEWKSLPFLALGHVVYSIAGYFVYKDILWVFTKIPYANMSSPYGKGALFHFIEQSPIVIGLPVFGMLVLGVISIGFYLWTRSSELRSDISATPLRTTDIPTATTKVWITEELAWIWLPYLAFLGAHSLFWYLGIFNSMGLNRVLIGVMPLMAIIALRGYHFFFSCFAAFPKLQTVLRYGFWIYLLIYPFTDNHGAVHWKRDMYLTTAHQSLATIGKSLEHTKNQGYVYYVNAPYICEVLDLNPFNPKERRLLFQHELVELSHTHQKAILIWADYCPEAPMTIRDIQAILPEITLLQKYEYTDDDGQIRRFEVWKRE